MGLKAKVGAYGCFDCHNVLDGRAPRPDHISEDELIEIFKRAAEATRLRLIHKGVIREEVQGTSGSDGGEAGSY